MRKITWPFRFVTAVLLCAVTVFVCGCSEKLPETDTGTSDTEETQKEQTEAEKLSELIDQLVSNQIPAEERSDLTEQAYIKYYSLSDEERAGVKNADKLSSLRDEAAKLCIEKEYGDKRIDHSKLQIGIYWVRLSDPEHIKEIKDCGFDFVWQPPGDKESLDNFEAAGLGVMEYVGELGVLPWLTEESDPEGYASYLGDVQIDHPAVWGYYLADEPDVYTMKKLNEHGSVLKKYLPYSASLVNLLPIYAQPDQLGTETYGEYIDTFIKTTDYEQIIYDNYNMFDDMPQTMENLWIVSDAAKNSNRDFWIIVGIFKSSKGLSRDQMLFEGFTAMAFGCVNVSYCCWTADGWGAVSVLDSEGNKTEYYDDLKEVTAELRSFSPVYMKYKHTATASLIGDEYQKNALGYVADSETEHGFDSLLSKKVVEMNAGKKDFALVGGFEKRSGDGEAFLIVNCTNYLFRKQSSSTVTFKVDESVKQVTAYVKGIPMVLTPEDGVYTVTVNDADAVFVTVD